MGRTKSDLIRDLAKYGMTKPGDRVLVAFSGGADSVCLLSLLLDVRKELGLSVSAAHVHHGIRGEEADRDAAFAAAFCRARNVPLFTSYVNVPALCAETGESPELCARRARYEYLDSLGFDKIATAHTGSDAVETLLMNLSRGSALRGLASIPPVRGNIIRPLIEWTAAETREYCKENNLPYVDDSTNFSDVYTRNRFRHGAIPALTAINPAFEANALRCIDTLRREEDYLSGAAEAALGQVCLPDGALDTRRLSALHPAMRLRVLSLYLLRQTAADLEYRHLDLLDAHLKSERYALTLPAGAIVRIENGRLSAPAPVVPAAVPAPVSVAAEGVYPFAGGAVRISSAPSCGGDAVDAAKLLFPLVLRSRAAGDALRSARRGCAKTLKKWFSEAGIPVPARAKIPVLSDANGVVWAAGFGADASRLPDARTDLTLYILWEDTYHDA